MFRKIIIILFWHPRETCKFIFTWKMPGYWPLRQLVHIISRIIILLMGWGTKGRETKPRTYCNGGLMEGLCRILEGETSEDKTRKRPLTGKREWEGGTKQWNYFTDWGKGYKEFAALFTDASRHSNVVNIRNKEREKSSAWGLEATKQFATLQLNTGTLSAFTVPWFIYVILVYDIYITTYFK
jgi:hypothetical protein